MPLFHPSLTAYANLCLAVSLAGVLIGIEVMEEVMDGVVGSGSSL